MRFSRKHALFRIFQKFFHVLSRLVARWFQEWLQLKWSCMRPMLIRCRRWLLPTKNHLLWWSFYWLGQVFPRFALYLNRRIGDWKNFHHCNNVFIGTWGRKFQDQISFYGICMICNVFAGDSQAEVNGWVFSRLELLCIVAHTKCHTFCLFVLCAVNSIFFCS